MSQYLGQEISKIKQLILELGGDVEHSVQSAVEAVQKRDESLSNFVVENLSLIHI